tara:strand:- start:7785 stop:8615 length:831 start_codon:yes stop_codon:yes gene_type:complete
MGLFNLSIDPGNVINLFVLLGPLFISTFFILYSSFQGTLAGIYWLIGALISQWAIGFPVRALFASSMQKSADKTFRKLISEGKTNKQAYNEMRMKANKSSFSSKRRWWTKKDSSSKGPNFRDMCSLFIQPYGNTLYGAFSMPSFNSIFHAFTFVFVLMQGIMDNPESGSVKVVLTIILLGVFGLLDAMKQIMKGCCAPQDIAVGALIGGGMGVGWYFLASMILNKKFYPNDEGSLFFFSGPFGMQTCSVDSKKRFKCVYDDNSGKPFDDDEIPEEE